MIIYLDMDGVSADFVKGVFDIFGEVEPKKMQNYDIHEWYDLESAEFWETLKREGRGYLFWRSLDETSEYSMLYDRIREQGHAIRYCTSPTLDAQSVQGKMLWMQDRHGRHFRNYHITPNKEELAAPNRILIDDSDEVVEKFERLGGNSILVPRPWNTLYDIYYNTSYVQIVREIVNRVEKITDGYRGRTQNKH